MHIRVPITAPRAAVWDALTDQRVLEQWFCEHADVDLDAGRYDFWGRFTPGAPDRDGGRIALEKVVERELLRFAWAGADVEISLRDAGDGVLVEVAFDDDADRTFREFWTLVLQHGLRGLLEFGIAEAGRFDFTQRSSFVSRSDAAPNGPSAQTVERVAPGQDRVEVHIDVDAPREDVCAVLVADLDRRWWVEEERRDQVSLDPPNSASTPFSIDGSAASVVTWTLDDSNGRTRVTLVHSGFAWSSDDEAIAHAHGWFDSLNWLKFLVEVGPHWLEGHKRVMQASGQLRAWF